MYKLQDVDKGVIFNSFLDVFYLQLKWFEYDINFDIMMKINDCYEFFEEFDVLVYLLKEVDRFELWEYEFYGVLVYSGDFNVGYYYVFLKLEKDGWWYKYDDDKVIKVMKCEVLEENFGGFYKIIGGCF